MRSSVALDGSKKSRSCTINGSPIDPAGLDLLKWPLLRTLPGASTSSMAWTSTAVAFALTTPSLIVPTPRRLGSTWAIVARVPVTRTTEQHQEETEETRGTPTANATVIRTAIGTRTANATLVGSATRMDVTTGRAAAAAAEIGANVVARPLPGAEGTHLTDGAGATRGALQEAAARDGIMMRRRLLSLSRRRRQRPAGKSHHVVARRCKRSRGN